MKTKDKKALQSKTLVELATLLREKRNELVKTTMNASLNKVKNVHLTFTLRKEIAYIQTAMRVLELAGEVKHD